MEIRGKVTKIIYEQKDFFVFSINQRIKVVLKKPFLLNQGMWVKCEGDFQQDPRYGESFLAFNIEEIEEEIRVINVLPFLISGIGDKKAIEIEKELGIEYIEKLIKNPMLICQFFSNKQVELIKEQMVKEKDFILKTSLDLLPKLISSKIKGLGIKKATEWVIQEKENIYSNLEESIYRYFGSDKLNAIYDATKNLEELIDTKKQLMDYGFSERIVLNLMKEYKEKTLSKISNNPYLPIKEGVPFDVCDNLALNTFCFDRESMHRVIYGSLEILKRNEEEGNTFINLESLLSKVSKLLSIKDIQYIQEIINMNAQFEDSEFIIEDGRVYRRIIYYTEKKIAKKIKEFLINQAVPSVATSYIEKSSASHGQKSALLGVLGNRFSVLTGGPGTGKTTCVKVLCGAIKSMGKTFALCAPTGRAAKRLSESTGEIAKTVHRTLEYKQLGMLGKFMKNEEYPLKEDYLIVDESSMLDVYLMNSILKALKSGSSVIFVGDVDQLPSINMGSILKDLKDSGVVPVFELKEVFRQGKESFITKNAYNIKYGYKLELEKGSDFAIVEFDSSNAVIEKLKSIVSRNKSFQVLCPVKSGDIGVDSINAFLQSVINPSDGKKGNLFYQNKLFRVSDNIIQLNNDYNKEVYNGEIGRIISIIGDMIKVNFPNNEIKEISYSLKDLKNIDLSYAISIHKSQGSEFDNVLLIIDESFKDFITKELFYTAVTRAKKGLLILTTLPISFLETLKESNVRSTNLKNLLALS